MLLINIDPRRGTIQTSQWKAVPLPSALLDDKLPPAEPLGDASAENPSAPLVNPAGPALRVSIFGQVRSGEGEQAGQPEIQLSPRSLPSPQAPFIQKNGPGGTEQHHAGKTSGCLPLFWAFISPIRAPSPRKSTFPTTPLLPSAPCVDRFSQPTRRVGVGKSLPGNCILSLPAGSPYPPPRTAGKRTARCP